MICHLRTHRECDCAAGSCQQQPKTPAPTVVPVWQDFLAALVFWIVVVGIGFGTYHVLHEQDHDFQLQARV